MYPTYPDLKNKHVLITGGVAGIGLGITRAFVSQGAQITILDRDAAGIKALEAELGLKGYVVELTDSDALTAVLGQVRQERPPVNVLIGNAGYDQRYDGLKMSELQWNSLFQLNVTHYFITCRELIPAMVENGGGSIILTSSHTAWVGKPDLICYNATKAAINGMTRSLAEAFGPKNIRANAVAPGWIMTERQLAEWVTPEAIHTTIHEEQALPVRLMPEMLANTYLFLGSDASITITRQILVCDAGQAKC